MAGKWEMEINSAGILSREGSETGSPVSGLTFGGNVMGGSGVCVGMDGGRVAVEVGGVMSGAQADTNRTRSRANLFTIKL